MNNNIFIKASLAIGIIILFVVSAVSSIVFGYNVRIQDEKELHSTTTHDVGLIDSAWPMFQHDTKHTGRSPFGKSGNWYLEKWNTNIGCLVYSSPSIDKDGTVYIGGYDWYLYAINPDGTEKWRFKTNGGIQSSPAISEDGTIYVGSNDGRLYAINPDGSEKWRKIVGDSWVHSAPVIDNDGIIYATSVRGKNICAFYPDGTVKWSNTFGDLVYDSPALDNNGIIYCGSHDKFLYALYPNNGTIKWKYNVGCWIGGDSTIDDNGTIYFGAVQEGALYALYPNGTYKWHLTLGSNVVSSPAIAEDGTIYVAAYKPGPSGAYIYSIDPEGSINWQYEVEDEAMSASPAIDKYGVIYVGGWNGNFYALNPDGTLKWMFKACGPIFPSVAINEKGIIYFGAHDTSQPEFYAKLYALEPIDDEPPEKPSISGPNKGGINIEYTYNSETTDPDDDNVSYFFDWGDGSNNGWTEFVPSGTPVSRDHSWKVSGNYNIKVKAKDEFNRESDWETLTVIMPRNRAIFNSLFLRFLERFPMLERILSILR